MARAAGARTIERALDIPAPAAWLFDLTQDYARRLDWDPFRVFAWDTARRLAGLRAYALRHAPGVSRAARGHTAGHAGVTT